MNLRTLMAVGVGAAWLTAGGARVRADDGALPVSERESAVNGVAKLVEENYVFPEVGRAMAEAIRDRKANQRYDGLDGPGLAQALTRDLRAVSHDLHLRVSHSVETLPPEPVADPLAEPPAEEVESLRREMGRFNFGVKKVEILDGNLGYLRLDVFAPPDLAADTYAAAMNFVSQTDALIIDLRYNGGSIHPDSVPHVCSYFFDKPVHINSLFWKPRNKTEDYWTLDKVPGKKYLDRPVYVLTSRRTFSGAEEFAYDLQNQKRATIVGAATGGGANPGGDRRVDDHFSVWVPIGRAINPITQTNWEGKGVQPDVEVSSIRALVTARVGALKQAAGKTNDPRWSEVLKDAISTAERDAGRFRTVEFTLQDHPEAREVFIAGDFNGWSDRAAPLTRKGDAWVAQVEVEPGEVAYKFIIDGEWVIDPANPRTQTEGDHTNSVRSVE